MQDEYFAGRVAVVTGGGRGIGTEYVRGLASAGATVVATDVLVERAESHAESLRGAGLDVVAHAVDVGDDASVERLFAFVDDQYGRLDVLVNNAAIMLDVDLDNAFKPFHETTWTEWRRVMDVNAGGILLCCRSARTLFERTHGGRVVNISSNGIYKGYDLQLAYFASKGAVSVMTRCLAREFGPIDVNVNAIAPGYTESEAVLRDDVMQQHAKPSVAAACAIKHEQQPKDLVGTLLFLCGPASACITGQTILVNCGAVML